MFKNQKFVIGVISLFMLLLRLLPISFGDIYSDNALNSFRAYGWFDWIGSGVQTTPFLWLGFAPWWSALSFHDAPPLAFLIQNIFFNIFGDSVFALRLPFVLAGIGSVFLVFFVLKKIADLRTASTAAVLYSFVSYGVWAGHSAYLEGIEEFFIVGSVLFGATYLFKNENYKYLYIWSAFTAAAVMTKYTAVFLIPPIAIYLFLKKNLLKKQIKHAILSTILFLLLLSPVIIYNIKVYELRGHFDAALSSMLGMRSGDFGLVNDRQPDLLKSGLNYTGFIDSLAGNISFPLLVLFGMSIVIALWRVRKSGLRTFESWILTNLFFLFLLFTFGTSGTRFISISVPFLVMIVAFGVVFIIENAKNNKLRYPLVGLVAAVFIFEFVYSFNTNFLVTPFGPSNWFYSESKIRNLGFNQLDSYIRENALADLPAKVSIKKVDDIGFSNADVRGKAIIIFDDRINWFSQMWYMQRYLFYYRLPVISSSALIPGWTGYVDVERLRKATGQKTYFIIPISQDVIDRVRVSDEGINYVGPSMVQEMEKVSMPSEIINNGSGIPTFKVYIIPALQ